jgi:hypothetical protein
LLKGEENKDKFSKIINLERGENADSFSAAVFFPWPVSKK